MTPAPWAMARRPPQVSIDAAYSQGWQAGYWEGRTAALAELGKGAEKGAGKRPWAEETSEETEEKTEESKKKKKKKASEYHRDWKARFQLEYREKADESKTVFECNVGKAQWEAYPEKIQKRLRVLYEDALRQEEPKEMEYDMLDGWVYTLRVMHKDHEVLVDAQEAFQDLDGELCGVQMNTEGRKMRYIRVVTAESRFRLV